MPEVPILTCDFSNFQVLSMSEELRRAFYGNNINSLDFDSYIPDLHGITEILTEEHRKQLSRHLPARAEGNCFSFLRSCHYSDSMIPVISFLK